MLTPFSRKINLIENYCLHFGNRLSVRMVDIGRVTFLMTEFLCGRSERTSWTFLATTALVAMVSMGDTFRSRQLFPEKTSLVWRFTWTFDERTGKLLISKHIFPHHANMPHKNFLRQRRWIDLAAYDCCALLAKVSEENAANMFQQHGGVTRNCFWKPEFIEHKCYHG